MEEEVSCTPSSSVHVSESTTTSTTLFPKSSDFDTPNDQALSEKKDKPDSSSILQSDGDEKELCGSLKESEDSYLEKTTDFDDKNLEDFTKSDFEDSDPVPKGDDQPDIHPEAFVSSVQSDKGNTEEKVDSISSGSNDKKEQEYPTTQTKKANPEENKWTDTVDTVPVMPVSTLTETDLQDDDLPVGCTTSESTYPTSCDMHLKMPDQPDQSDPDFVTESDILDSVTRKSDNTEEHRIDALIPHVTKTTAKFDNIFEAMTSDIENSAQSDSENSHCNLQEKSAEGNNTTILTQDLQTAPDSNLVSLQKDEKEKETISFDDIAEQSCKNNSRSTFKNTSLKFDQAASSVVVKSVISEDFSQTNQSKFQSEESVLSEISKMCEQVNMADDSDNSPPSDVSDSVSEPEDSNLSISQDVVNAPVEVNRSSKQQESNKLPHKGNDNPQKQTDCSKADNQYSLSSEAERREEIMAMQRDLYGDDLENRGELEDKRDELKDSESSIQQPSKDDFTDPLQAVSNSGQQGEGKDSTAAKTSSPVMTIKEEPMDYDDYPTVANHAETNYSDSYGKPSESSATADGEPNNSSELLMSEVMSLNSSQTLLELASKHLDSMAAVAGAALVGEESVVVENVRTTQDQLQSFIKSLENAEAECISVTERVKYKAPKIPFKLQERFPKGPFTCYGCEDSFLFKSSLYTHLNRKCVQIVCKNDQCLNSKQKVEFFNRCSYLIHCRLHDKRSGASKFEVSCATDDMLEDISDMADLPSSKAYFTDFKKSLNFSWTCVECNFKLDSAKALASHFVPTLEGLQGIQCDICKKHLFTKCALAAHKRTHSQKNPYVCPECGQLFLGSWDAFSKHLNVKCFHTYRQPSLTCPKCSITGSSFDKMTQHLLCHKEVYLKCQKCPMAFKAVKNIQTHMKTTHKIEDENFSYAQVFKCSTCDTVFHNLNHLTIYTSKHVEQFNKAPKYNFKCWICPNIFNNRAGIEKHLSKTHRIKPCQTLCDLCGLIFENLADLLTHFESKGCLKFPNSSNSLTGKCTQTPREDGTVVQTALEQVQQPSRPKKNKIKIKVKKTQVVSPDRGSYYKCGACEFKCNKANISEINSHIRKHRADGIYLCSICLTAVFDTFNDLHRHQFLCRMKKASKKGSPTKDNSAAARTCQKCSANFPTDAELTEHMHTDHGISLQFPCHLCGLTYDTQHSLYQHIQLVHEGKKHLYLCWICQSKNLKRTFTTATKLERHLVVKHRVARNIIDPEKFPRLLPGLNQKDTIIDQAPEQDNKEGNKQVPIKRLKLADDTVFRCAKCQFSTENREEFEVHIKAHKIESTSRQCPECGLCFSVLPSLKKHLIMVHKIKDISTYVRTSGLDQTQHVEPPAFTKSPNSGSLSDIDMENPLDCRVCFKNFDSEISLKTHMRTHGMAFIRSKRILPSFPSQTPESK